MNHLTDLPAWAAIPVCILLLLGSVITLVGSMGLIRLKTFYGRLHAPTLGASAGTILICVASMITFAVLQNRWILHEILIIVFIILTTPVTLCCSANRRCTATGSKARTTFRARRQASSRTRQAWISEIFYKPSRPRNRR